MVKKSIAATLLLATLAWAEMSIAPMLLMHGKYFHHPNLVAQTLPAGHHHVMPAGHSCCPQISQGAPADQLNFVADSLPCQDEHRCCFLQGPQNVPSPVTAGKKIAPEITLAANVELAPVLLRSRNSSATNNFIGRPPTLLGTVLRI